MSPIKMITRGILAATLWSSPPSSAETAAPAAAEPDLHVSPARMAEWNRWRFGMFIHWGPWSQTGIGYIWKIVNEDPPDAREKRFELYRTFNPVHFAPEKWARAAREAGMKYVVFVTKHHDGFNNYDTALSDFKITSPEVPWSKQPQADITRAVIDAFRAEGLAIGLYYSHIDWHHPDGRYFSARHWDYDATRVDRDPESWRRFVEYEKGQVRELLTHYGKIDIIWFDIMWPFAGGGGQKITHPQVRQDALELIKMMKELQPGIIFNDRGTDVFGGFNTPEQRIPATGLPGFWESNITITNGRGFWFKGDAAGAKSPRELIRLLIDIAAKGGNFLMNVGPRPDGELSASEYAGLRGVGDWMKVNHESIHGATRSLFWALPWGRSTTKGSTLYLHVFDWPPDGKLAAPGLRNPIKRAWLLADPKRAPLAVESAGENKIIHVGPKAVDAVATVVAVEIEGAPDIHNAIRQVGGGPIVLGAALAGIQSQSARYNYGRATREGDFIEGIRSTTDRISWPFTVDHPGRYRIEIEYAAQAGQSGGEFVLRVDDQPPLRATVQGTAEWKGDILDAAQKSKAGDQLGIFRSCPAGDIALEHAGPHTLEIQPTRIVRDHLMYLRSVKLTPLE